MAYAKKPPSKISRLGTFKGSELSAQGMINVYVDICKNIPTGVNHCLPHMGDGWQLPACQHDLPAYVLVEGCLERAGKMTAIFQFQAGAAHP